MLGKAVRNEGDFNLVLSKNHLGPQSRGYGN